MKYSPKVYLIALSLMLLPASFATGQPATASTTPTTEPAVAPEAPLTNTDSTAHPERVVSVTATQWVDQLNNGGTTGTWPVQVVNSDNQISNSGIFTVSANNSPTRQGVDYSFSRPSPSGLKAAGYDFVIRYVGGSTSKDITPSEARALQAPGVGLDIIIVFEDASNEMLGGYATGVADAKIAVSQAMAAGAPQNFFCYFGCDFNASSSDQPAINAYLDGAASVLGGVARVGIYGPYAPLKDAMDAGKASKGWQTLSWSNGNVYSGISLYQYDLGVNNQGMSIAGGICDLDYGYGNDLGQWPVLPITGSLRVNIAPADAISSGQIATLSIAVTGSNLTYQWYRGNACDNSNPISGATAATYITPTLTATTSYWVLISSGTSCAPSETATVTVNATRSFAACYFGVCDQSATGASLVNGGHPSANDAPTTRTSGNDGNQGSWALYVRSDNTGVFIACLSQSKTAIVQNATINLDGSFSVSGSLAAQADGTPRSLAIEPAVLRETTSNNYILSGQIVSGQVAGQISGLGLSMTGSADATNGSAQAVTGFYTASALGTSTGKTYTVVGPSGQALVVTTSPTVADGATGTVNSSGQLIATTVNGGQLNLNVNQAAQSITATLTPSGALAPISYAGLSDTTPSTARLASLSGRASAGTGDQTLILGFYIGGAGSKQVLIRGIGPTLAQYGVSGVLADPQLKLFNTANTQINQNDDWSGSTALANAFAAVNDFPLPANSKDAALLVPLPLNGYTAQVNGAGTSTGVALIEAYEADIGTPAARFTALSARSQVGTGENIIIAGFVVTGNAPKTLLIRGIGPTLANYGVNGVLADPKVELYAGNAKIYENDNWGGTTALSDAFTATQAFPLPANSKDAALLVTLQPGLYTAQVSGVGGTTGVALVEVYEMP